MVPAGHNRPRGAPNSSTLLPSLGKEAMLATAGRGDLPWSLIPAPPTATKSSPVSRGAGEPLSLPGGGGRLSPGRLPAPPVQGWLVPCLGPFKVFFSISVSIQAPLFSSFKVVFVVLYLFCLICTLVNNADFWAKSSY